MDGNAGTSHWMSLSRASELVAESVQTIRRRADDETIRSRRNALGHREVWAEDIRTWRTDVLARLGVHEEPLDPPTDRGSETRALSTDDTGQLDRLQREVARLTEALALAMTADDVTDERASTWKGVARALMAPLPPNN